MGDHLFELVVGSYVFAAGAYVFGFLIYKTVTHVRILVTNHQTHRFEDIEKRLDRLEDVD